jgi:hypothetical protein
VKEGLGSNRAPHQVANSLCKLSVFTACPPIMSATRPRAHGVNEFVLSGPVSRRAQMASKTQEALPKMAADPKCRIDDIIEYYSLWRSDFPPRVPGRSSELLGNYPTIDGANQLAEPATKLEHSMSNHVVLAFMRWWNTLALRNGKLKFRNQREAAEFVRRVQNENGGPNAKIVAMRQRYVEINRARAKHTSPGLDESNNRAVLG